MEENWRSVCAWASGIYMLLIFGGQTYMANRSEASPHLVRSDRRELRAEIRNIILMWWYYLLYIAQLPLVSPQIH